jgi:hypothetical protein
MGNTYFPWISERTPSHVLLNVKLRITLEMNHSAHILAKKEINYKTYLYIKVKLNKKSKFNFNNFPTTF